MTKESWFDLHGQMIFFSKTGSEAQPASRLMCTAESFPSSKVGDHLHLVPSLRMSGALLLLPPYVFMVCTETTLLLYFWTKILHSSHHLPNVAVFSHISSKYWVLPSQWMDSFMVICNVGCWSLKGYRVTIPIWKKSTVFNFNIISVRNIGQL
jgi:hypothetical protein